MPKTKTTHTPGPSHSIDAAVLRKEWEIADREALREIIRKQKETVSALLAALTHALPGLIGESERIARAAIVKAEGK